MTTATDICNQALGKLGAQLISDITDASAEAQLCRSFYRDVKDAVLEEGRWNFARRAITLSKASRVEDPPNAWNYRYAFPKPNESLLILRCYDNNHRDPYQVDWQLQGRFILTDAEQLWIDCYIRIDNPDEFTATFKQALVYRMARELALPLTNNQNLFENMAMLYTKALDDALAVDGMQGRNEELPPGRLIQVRSGPRAHNRTLGDLY